MKLTEIEFDLNYPKEQPIDLIEDMVKKNLLLGRNAEILSFNILKLLKLKNNKPLYFPLYDERKKLKIGDNGCEEQSILKKGYGCIYLVNNSK
tara:strand:+ start:154 stop:432 length:279 start_codon:yes stop_codon:yes gene_type:complete